MARKIDPIVRVLEFFETASLEVVAIALALVKAAVKRRMPAPAKVTRRRRAKPDVPGRAPTVAPLRLHDGAPPPAPAAAPTYHDPTERTKSGMPRRRRRTGIPADPPARKPDAGDLALPGLGSGTVGE